MNRRKVEDVVENFNQRSRDFYWNGLGEDRKSEIKNKFEDYLTHAKQALIDKYAIFDANGIRLIDCKSEKYSDTYFRLMIGYGMFGTKGIKSGIYTQDSIDSEKKTDDHLIGATMIGETAFVEYCKSDFDIEHMKERWLYENLYLWMTIAVSEKEHLNGNILRNENSIEEKLKLEHYINVSDRFFDLREIVYFKITEGAIDKSVKMRRSKSKEFLLKMSSEDAIVESRQNKAVLKELLKKGLVRKYSEYV